MIRQRMLSFLFLLCCARRDKRINSNSYRDKAV
jgi:hypothetical protein